MEQFETFAPTFSPETLRTLLQLSSKQDHVMHLFDVKAVFLHSLIEQNIYQEQPQEILKHGSDGKILMCRLSKSTYGLKRAAHNCYKDLGHFLLIQLFTRSRNIGCLFAKAQPDVHTFLLVWVEDIIVVPRTMTVTRMSGGHLRSYKTHLINFSDNREFYS